MPRRDFAIVWDETESVHFAHIGGNFAWRGSQVSAMVCGYHHHEQQTANILFNQAHSVNGSLFIK